MWKEWVAQKEATAVFSPGAQEQDIANAEQILHTLFPEELRALLMETDGISGDYGPFIWSIERLLQCNLTMRCAPNYRDNYQSFEHLLFFGASGVDGILIAFVVKPHGSAAPSVVYQWDPIEDHRVMVASSLLDFLIRWFNGTLTEQGDPFGMDVFPAN